MPKQRDRHRIARKLSRQRFRQFGTRNAAGALTEVGTPVAAGTTPFSVTVDPSGKFVYVANFNSANVSVYTIDATTGALTAGTTVAAGTAPASVTTTGVLE